MCSHGLGCVYDDRWLRFVLLLATLFHFVVSTSLLMHVGTPVCVRVMHSIFVRRLLSLLCLLSSQIMPAKRRSITSAAAAAASRVIPKYSMQQRRRWWWWRRRRQLCYHFLVVFYSSSPFASARAEHMTMCRLLFAFNFTFFYYFDIFGEVMGRGAFSVTERASGREMYLLNRHRRLETLVFCFSSFSSCKINFSEEHGHGKTKTNKQYTVIWRVDWVRAETINGMHIVDVINKIWICVGVGFD